MHKIVLFKTVNITISNCFPFIFLNINTFNFKQNKINIFDWRTLYIPCVYFVWYTCTIYVLCNNSISFVNVMLHWYVYAILFWCTSITWHSCISLCVSLQYLICLQILMQLGIHIKCQVAQTVHLFVITAYHLA